MPLEDNKDRFKDTAEFIPDDEGMHVEGKTTPKRKRNTTFQCSNIQLKTNKGNNQDRKEVQTPKKAIHQGRKLAAIISGASSSDYD